MPVSAIAGGNGLPPEPNWSTLYTDELDLEIARAQWGLTVREMSAEGVLTPANGPAIRRLVDFTVQYERAARHVAENGSITKAKRALTGQFNPYWTVMKHAGEEVRILEGLLGITPTTRSKATKVKREKKTERASDRFLKSVV